LPLLSDTQSAFPVSDACERIRLASGIEDDQRNSGFIQMELMDDAISWLSGEIPKERLARLGHTRLYFHVAGLEGPHMSTRGGICFLVWMSIEHHTQSRLADTGIAHHDDLCVDVVSAIDWRLA
jgi:hypothetical protein